jgi:1,4-alpha-glucan branching enzyme
MPKGYLALILHAHLPFVRHPEHASFLEEDWLFEAITETYIPLLDLLERLAGEGLRCPLAMTLTAPLAAMLADPLLQERYARHLDRLQALIEAETERARDLHALRPVVALYRERIARARELYFGRWSRDLPGAFARLQRAGHLEILACAATHGFLPLLASSPPAVRAQILTGCRAYERAFGQPPRGFWLPECAYIPGVEELLREAGVRWFLLDSHGLLFAKPRPRHGIFAPIYTPAGPAAFARDRESSRQVWSAEEGYPGDPSYRDFYRDIGFDLPLDYMRPFLPDGMRRFTGLKYHRITGASGSKELYRRDGAMAAAASHAAHFVEHRRAQCASLAGVLPSPPIIVSPFDAELFGHWWFEGPEFLEQVLRLCAADPHSLELITPAGYLTRHPTQQVAMPAPSSWGNRGYWEVWLDDCNSWIYPHLHECARRMTLAAHRGPGTDAQTGGRVLCQMARELLLAQSSDWAFLMKTGTAKPYAEARTRSHIERFLELDRRLEAGVNPEPLLSDLEQKDNLFPELDWRVFL